MFVRGSIMQWRRPSTIKLKSLSSHLNLAIYTWAEFSDSLFTCQIVTRNNTLVCGELKECKHQKSQDKLPVHGKCCEIYQYCCYDIWGNLRLHVKKSAKISLLYTDCFELKQQQKERYDNRMAVNVKMMMLETICF